MEKAKVLTDRHRCKDYARIRFSVAKPVAKPDLIKTLGTWSAGFDNQFFEAAVLLLSDLMKEIV